MKTVFTGITKNLSGRTKEDGELSELLNLRHDGAILRPIGVPEGVKIYSVYNEENPQENEEYTLKDGEKIVFIHQFKGREFVITYYNEEIILFGELINDKIIKRESEYVILNSPGLIEIVQLGAYIYIHTQGENFLRMMKYKSSLEEVEYYNSDISKIDIQMFAREEKTDKSATLYDSISLDKNKVIAARYQTERSFNTNIDAFQKEGNLFNTAIIRGAFKLKNGGTYALHTAPILINPPTDGKRIILQEKLRSRDYLTFGQYNESQGQNQKDFAIFFSDFYATLYIQGVKVKINIPEIKNIKDFEEELEAFDIFIAEIKPNNPNLTKPLYSVPKDKYTVTHQYGGGGTTHKVELDINNVGVIEGNDAYVYGRIDYSYPYYGEDEIKDKILGITDEQFKFIKRYSLDEIRKGVFSEDLPLAEFFKGEIKDPGGTEMLPSYNAEEGDRSTLYGTPFVYNSCLHLGNLAQMLFEGYNPNSFISVPKTSETILGLSIKWEKEGFSVYKEGSQVTDYSLGYMISYPNLEMDYCNIRALKYKNGTYYKAEKKILSKYIDTFDLDRISCIMNVVEGRYTYSYLTEDQVPAIGTSTYERFNPIELTWEAIEDSEVDYEFLGQPSNNTQLRSNDMKVSEENFPNKFPDERVYRIGQGEIRGYSVANTALSQGQFGQFPLYVFCSDGIYAMNVGTDVAYSNSTPVSRDVITGDLISIDNAIAFISDRSLKILQGTTVTDVSLVMQSNSYEEKDDRFEDFIQGARLAYNYFFGEIYLLREDKDFAYVYELNSQTWSKRDFDFKDMFNVYPDLYIQTKEGEVVRLSRELAPDGRVHEFTLKTRPMNWGDGFKKVARMIIRGLVMGNWEVRILASNDGVNFNELRRASITTDSPKRDIPFGRISGSFKSYILEIKGTMDERAYIEYVETELQDSIFNKKIR